MSEKVCLDCERSPCVCREQADEERNAQSELVPALGSAPTAESLLERAHDMLARAHIMLDGWQQAMEWHLDYLRWKKRMEGPEDPIDQRKERCKLCGKMVSDWVDPDWARGRICRECETAHEPNTEVTDAGPVNPQPSIGERPGVRVN